MQNRILVLFVCLLSLYSCQNKKNENIVNTNETFDSFLFIGTYTTKDSKGIYLYKLNTETGDSKLIGETPIANPSYLAIGNNGRNVYAVSESGKESSLTSFTFDKVKGSLTEMETVATAEDPCYVAVDDNLNLITVAEYTGGSIAVFTTLNQNGADTLQFLKRFEYKGSGIDKVRQDKPHLHQTLFTPQPNKFLANDLGKDKIYEFSIIEDQSSPTAISIIQSNEISVKPGSGPRHTIFHPNGKFAYTITELSGEVIVFDYNNVNGLLTEKQTVLADTLHAGGSADVQITPDGKFLYASNRLKGDGVAIFSINPLSGELTKLAYQTTGIHPRNIAITPNGKLLMVANRDSDNVEVFKIEEDGLLTNLNKNIHLSMPVCLKFTSIN